MVYPPQPIVQGEILGTLIDKADLQGYVPPEDVTELCPTDDEERILKIFTALRRLGVEIINENDENEISDPLPGSLEDSPYDPVYNLEHISADDTVWCPTSSWEISSACALSAAACRRSFTIPAAK